MCVQYVGRQFRIHTLRRYMHTLQGTCTQATTSRRVVPLQAPSILKPGAQVALHCLHSTGSREPVPSHLADMYVPAVHVLQLAHTVSDSAVPSEHPRAMYCPSLQPPQSLHT